MSQAHRERYLGYEWCLEVPSASNSQLDPCFSVNPWMQGISNVLENWLLLSFLRVLSYGLKECLALICYFKSHILQGRPKWNADKSIYS